MSGPKVCYCGSYEDYSGYGSANRAFITALNIAGADVVAEPVVQVVDKTNHGWMGELCKSLENRTIPYKIKIVHLTPDLYNEYLEEGKYNIGHLFWETDRLPDEWVPKCNMMQEIWTSSDNMIQVLKASGVTVPMYAFPQPVNIADADKDYQPFSIENHRGFLFYSIFQWIERKNPQALLSAYWDAFEGREDVTLLLKTHRVNFQAREFDTIRSDIKQWKRAQVQKHYPRVLLCRALLDNEDIMRLHKTGDCYIQVDRGEGWSRTIQEALMFGKTVISTARGGIHEYLKNEHYFRVPSEYVEVRSNSWIPWYTNDQKWAEVDPMKLRETMQYVFKNRILANTKGITAKEFVKEEFSFHKVGVAMVKRLNHIYKVHFT